MSSQREYIFKLHARERMVERNIKHDEVVKTIERGVKIVENDRTRAILEVDEGRFITVLYTPTRKAFVIHTAFESNRTDVRLYRRVRK